jgi:hypothetical protein
MDNNLLWPEVICADGGLQESITSYLYRAAELNAISVADLVRCLIAPAFVSCRLSRDLAGKNSCMLEGCSGRSLSILNTLEKVYAFPELALHTCWPLVNVLSGVHMLRRTSAWCPACLEGWRRIDEKRVYQPLLWRFNHVVSCPIHAHPLATICPYCAARPRTYSGIGRVGCCANCGRWLGNAIRRAERTKLSEWGDELGIAGLLSSFQDLGKSTGNFFKTLNLILSIGVLTKSDLRRALQCEVGVYERCLPTIETVLRVSALAGISPANLLRGNVNLVEAESYRRERATVPGRRVFDYDAAAGKMEVASRQQPELSLSTLCKQVGVARTSFVANRPSAAGRIRRRYLSEMKKRKTNELELIERAIDRLIESNRYPSWSALKKECPGVYADQEYMEVVNELLLKRGFVRNARGYLVAK